MSMALKLKEEEREEKRGQEPRQQEQIEKIPIRKLNLNDLRVICPLGRGAKGAVFRVRVPGSSEDLALKVVSKANIKNKIRGNNNNGDMIRGDKGSKMNSVVGQSRVWFEQEVLKALRYPLLPRLRGVVETENVVGYAIDYCPGGDLNSLRRRQSEKTFSDEIIRFYGAELVLALEYLHQSGIVYRDLKPENVLIQENGHLMLVDFDLSTKLAPRSPITRPPSPPRPNTQPDSPRKSKKKSHLHRLFCCGNSGVSPVDRDPSTIHKSYHRASPSESDSVEKSNSFVGTEDYVAPEIVAGDGHDFAVDWWCLGVVLYEMLYGTTPFRGLNKKETFYRILTKTPNLVGETTRLRDLIRRLLEKDPKKRIQLDEIKGHEFFRGVAWDRIWWIQRPPFIPRVTKGIGVKGQDETEVDVAGIVQGMFDGKIDEAGDSHHEKEKGKVIRDGFSPKGLS